MKTTKITKVLLTVLLSSVLISFAKKKQNGLNQTTGKAVTAKTTNQGVRTGSGGDGVACHNDQGKIEKVLLWDYIEAEHRNGYTLELGSPSFTTEETFNYLIDKLVNKIKNKNLAEDLKQHAKGFIGFFNGDQSGYFGKNAIRLINKGVQENPKYEIEDLKDLKPDLNLIEKSCNLVQLAKQGKKSEAGSPFLIIDDYYFSKMVKSHQAGLLLHEFLLLFINLSDIETALESTYPARKLTAITSSDQINEISNMAFEIILKDLGLIKDYTLKEKIEDSENIPLSIITYLSSTEDINNMRLDLYGQDSFVINNAIKGVMPDENISVKVTPSKITYSNGLIQRIVINKKSTLSINTVHDENLSVTVDEEQFFPADTSVEIESEYIDCGITFDYNNGNESLSRDMTIGCFQNDIVADYFGQKIKFAKNGVITLTHAYKDNAIIKSGVVYGGQKIVNPEDGQEITIGTLGKCSKINLNTQGDLVNEKVLSLIEISEESFECPSNVRAQGFF